MVFKALLVLFLVLSNLLILPICPFKGLLYIGHPESETSEVSWGSRDRPAPGSEGLGSKPRYVTLPVTSGVITALCASFLSPEIWGRYIFISKILSCFIHCMSCFFRLQDYRAKLLLTLNFHLGLSWSLLLPDLWNSFEIMSKSHLWLMVQSWSATDHRLLNLHRIFSWSS